MRFLMIAAVRILIVVYKYDDWCCDHVEALLKALEEWLSISQKRAEQGMIVLYLALSLLGCWPTKLLSIGAESVMFASVGYLMYAFMHRNTAAHRIFIRYSRFGAIGRGLVQIVILAIVAFELLVPPYRLRDIASVSAQLDYLLFFYSTHIYSGGEPGRHRKLALAKLKELFGTEWVPKPLPVPW